VGVLRPSPRDLRTQRAGLDRTAQRLQPLPADAGREHFAGDAPLELQRGTGQRDKDHPAAVADRADGLVPGLAAGGVEQQVDATGTC
jgi:hypothetical protein